MYKNIGKKLKVLASVFGLGGSGISLLIGLIIAGTAFSGGGRGYYQGYSSDVGNGLMWFLIFFGIAVVCFVSSWVLYGFGQLIESTQNIERKLLGDNIRAMPAYSHEPLMSDSKHEIGKCNNCGYVNNDDSRYCIKCGNILRLEDK